MQNNNNTSLLINELHQKATIQFDDNAAIELDDLITNKKIYSYENNKMLVEALKACASKHNKECQIRLIDYYDRQIKRYMNYETINFRKVKFLIKDCIKWCEITTKDGHGDFSKKIKELLALGNKNIKHDNTSHPLYKKMKKINIIHFVFSMIFIVLFIVFCTIKCFIALILPGCFFVYIIIYYAYLKRKWFYNEEIIKNEFSYTPKNEKKWQLTDREESIGFLGEEYIHELITNPTEEPRRRNFFNWFNEALLHKFNISVGEDVEVEWINKEHETTKPFDFTFTKKGHKTIFVEIKTSKHFDGRSHMSYKENEFIKNLNIESSIYVVLLIKGFKFTNKQQFFDENIHLPRPRLIFIDPLNESELQEFKIKIQTKEEFEDNIKNPLPV